MPTRTQTGPRQGAGRPKEPDRHTSPREMFHLDPELRDVLIEHCRSSQPTVTKSAVLRDALARYFKDLGKWPRNGKAAAPA